MNFMKWKWLYLFISLLVIIPGVVSLVTVGLKPAIDFTGGSLLEIQFTQVATDQSISADDIKTQLAEVFQIEQIQSSGQNQVLIKGKPSSNEAKNLAIEVLQEKYGEVKELRFETVGPTLGKELLIKTIIGVGIVAGIILIYVWMQFSEPKYGVSAVLAMFHDTLVLVGVFSLLGYYFQVEVDVLFVTAVLTTLSFSVHDTIVVYDRIRELRTKHARGSLETIINTAVTETLSRSFNNSMTIIIMLASIALLGGESIRWFVVALLVGAVTGTYSSTFTAAPLLLVWETIAEKIKK